MLANAVLRFLPKSLLLLELDLDVLFYLRCFVRDSVYFMAGFVQQRDLVAGIVKRH